MPPDVSFKKKPVRKSNPTAALPSFAWLAWLHRSTRLRMSNVGDGSTRHGDMKAKGGEGGAEPFSRQNSWWWRVMTLIQSLTIDIFQYLYWSASRWAASQHAVYFSARDRRLNMCVGSSDESDAKGVVFLPSFKAAFQWILVEYQQTSENSDPSPIENAGKIMIICQCGKKIDVRLQTWVMLTVFLPSMFPISEVVGRFCRFPTKISRFIFGLQLERASNGTRSTRQSASHFQKLQ